MQQPERLSSDGSPGAVLYQRYAPAIFAYLYRQTASREDAEDLLVDVFLVALQREQFLTTEVQDQQAWIWRVTRNKLADHFRRFNRHPSVSFSQLMETMDEREGLTPEQAALKHEEFAQLSATVRALSGLQQEILRLRYGHGLSFAEIAPILDKSEAAIRMIFSRTLKLLRGLYQQQEKGTR